MCIYIHVNVCSYTRTFKRCMLFYVSTQKQGLTAINTGHVLLNAATGPEACR